MNNTYVHPALHQICHEYYKSTSIHHMYTQTMRHTFQVTLGKEIPDIFLVEDVIWLLAVSQQEAGYKCKQYTQKHGLFPGPPFTTNASSLACFSGCESVMVSGASYCFSLGKPLPAMQHPRAFTSLNLTYNIFTSFLSVTHQWPLVQVICKNILGVLAPPPPQFITCPTCQRHALSVVTLAQI